MNLLGIDPSFSSAGLAIINTEDKLISFERLEGSMGKRYQEIFYEAMDRCKRLVKVVREYNIDSIISEEPLPQAQASSGLFMLDSMLFYTLILEGVSQINTSHVTHLKHIHGGKYTKTDSVKLAKKFTEVFISKGYELNRTRFNNDEAEAFIYACRLYVSKFDDNIKNELIKICPNIKNKKEQQLFPRIR